MKLWDQKIKVTLLKQKNLSAFLKKEFFFLLLFSFKINNAFANSGNDSTQNIIDSLDQQLSICKSDSGKAILNNRIVIEYFSLGVTKDLIAVVEKFNADAVKTCRKISFQKGLAEALLMRGKIEISYEHDFGKATNDFLESKKVYENLKDSSGISKCYLQLGLMSYLLQYNEDAVRSLAESLGFNKKLDLTSGQANYLTALSYMELRDFNNSERFFIKAIEIYKRIAGENGTHGLIECYSYMAKMYVLSDRIENANKCFARIDTLSNFKTDNQTKARLLAIKCGAFLKLNQIENAIRVGLEAHQVADKYNDELTNSEADLHLFRAYELKGDYKNAFHYLYELKNLSDSLFSLNAGQRVAEIRTKYEFDNQLLIEKQQQEQRETIADNEIAKQKTIKNGIISGSVALLLILILGFLLYRNSRTKKEIQLKHTISDVEMKALRSQMNPHFIFNSLQSIQNFLTSRNTEDANVYLLKFSKLMRMVLENSQYAEITLREDLKALELYMQLESLRLKYPFTYKMQIENMIDDEQTYIPPLILQPFVENAIWHGLQYKNESGHINIYISKKGNTLTCIVEDNGIGRNLSQKFKGPMPIKKESLGMKLTEDRLKILSELKKIKAHFKITDLFNTENQPSGTMVELSLPESI